MNRYSLLIKSIGGEINMPAFDGTGPQGKGPGTGRGMGPCGKGKDMSQGFGRGQGRGRRFGQTQVNETKDKKQE